MPFIIGSAIAGAGAIGGALIGANASKKAAGAQAGAANSANQVAAGQFDQTQKNLSPWLNSGTAANDYLSQLLGIPGYEGGGRVINGKTYGDINQVKDIWRNDQRNKLIGLGRDPNAIDEQGINQGAGEAWHNGQATGSAGSNFGQLTKPFGLDQFQESPAYQFNLAEGRKAIDKASAARGKYYQPSTLQDIAKFSQGLASNEYQNAFNNYNTSMGNIYSRIQGASGSGQNAAAQLGGYSQNFANTTGNNLIGAGNAQAAGQIGQANAVTGAMSQGYNAYVLNQILQRNQAPSYPTGGQTGSFDPMEGVFA